MVNSQLSDLKDALLKSHWPQCNILAKELIEIGGNDAKEALIGALRAKRHHVRTAAIVNLSKFSDVSLAIPIRPYLNDPSYETRMAAKAAIQELSGEAVLTGRGE